jgi:hypothetical protein
VKLVGYLLAIPLSLVWLRAASPGAVDPSGAPLLSNGDFSVAIQNPAWPDDWKQKPGIDWEAEGGVHYLRFAAGPSQSIELAREIFMPPTSGIRALQITVRYRTHDLKIGAGKGRDAQISLHFFDAVRIEFDPAPEPIVFSSDASNWTVVTRNVAVREHATSVVVALGLNRVEGGTVDIASISLKSAPVAKAPQPTATSPAAEASAPTAVTPIRREGDRTIIGYGSPSVWFIHPYVDVLGHDFDMGIDHLVEQARAQGHPLAVGVANTLEPVTERYEANTIYVFSYKNINYPLPADAKRMVFINTWLTPSVAWPASRTGKDDVVVLGSRTLHNNGDGLATNKDRWMQIQKDDPALSITLLDATGYYLPISIWRTAVLKAIEEPPPK